MQVIENCSASLSNYEVLNLLQKVEPNEKMNNLATITYLASKYLEDTPCIKQNPEKIRKFLQEIGSFNLTKCEKLTLLNLCPTTPLEIQLIIEDSEDRLSDDDVEAVLQIIANLREDEQQDTKQT
ncbi:PREDICTED: DNA-directed RNA polymerase III subunit rpc9 [Dinoponera quadriceps]|uniref:DNA-directed RNA polymerase III subunit RPC9 n=1 Tax=Dinoponera quadriceps TaxID=609295 RepID=A0A6P3Y5T3_DINQU|nr:PREDICTED: DNA-directed RNA polymerase III subunit rpc9 [Dinoponera quadriceps]XP_014485436.1 PREDICTED: DNA-directed RNA polymerase III subunit rpc9 [Dinoponera quadriceps]XP_014485437.1 PREDICTED: DNA-directed RNA polymerase III subunit rpc9 [Dinoponera quadriceps]